MAKKALILKAAAKPKFAVRAYTRCQRCGRPKSVYRKFGLCRICIREMANRGEKGFDSTMTMTDPIADMLTRLRNANQAYHDKVSMPYSKIKANIAEVLKAEGYVSSWLVEVPEEDVVGKTLVV